jgi:hypothetical protein
VVVHDYKLPLFLGPAVRLRLERAIGWFNLLPLSSRSPVQINDLGSHGLVAGWSRMEHQPKAGASGSEDS